MNEIPVVSSEYHYTSTMNFKIKNNGLLEADSERKEDD
jgi:hypothetical protein